MGHSAGKEFLGGFDFALGHLPFASAFATGLTRDFNAGASSFNREFLLHLRHTCHDVEEEAPRGGAGVNGIGEALEPHTLLVKLAYQAYEMLDAAAEPIKFSDHQRIAIGERFLCFE